MEAAGPAKTELIEQQRDGYSILIPLAPPLNTVVARPWRCIHWRDVQALEVDLETRKLVRRTGLVDRLHQIGLRVQCSAVQCSAVKYHAA